MAGTYSLAEAFRLAEAIERNGEKFYSQAAAAAPNDRVRDIFASLARQEDKHAGLFAQWRQHYCHVDDVHLVDADDQVLGYIEAMAASHVFNLEDDVTRLLASVQTPQSALGLAMNFEKDSIAFFTALKDAVAPEHRIKMEQLIQEEMDHIRQLRRALPA